MFKTIILTVLMILPACAKTTLIPFSSLFSGDRTEPLGVTVAGLMDTAGVNFYSLSRSPNAAPEDCIALILKRHDQFLAKTSNRKRVVVRGRVFSMDELDQVIPRQHGQINGRQWSVTKCAAKMAIYVTDLRQAASSSYCAGAQKQLSHRDLLSSAHKKVFSNCPETGRVFVQ